MEETRNMERGMELPGLSLQMHHPPNTMMHSLTWKLSEPLWLGLLWRFCYETVIDEIIGQW